MSPLVHSFACASISDFQFCFAMSAMSPAAFQKLC